MLFTSFKQIQQASKRVSLFCNQTSLKRQPWLEAMIGSPFPIYFKQEFEQPTGSFKVRGAFNALQLLSPRDKKKGVITRSSGNFAQALAYAGNKLDISVTVVMPIHSPKVKQLGVISNRAELILEGIHHQEAQNKVDELAHITGKIKLSSYDHPHVIEGQGTCGLEIIEELKEDMILLAPVGGGGLLSGVSSIVKQFSTHRSMIISVEPIAVNTLERSKKENRSIKVENSLSCADGLLAPQLGQHNWPLLQNYVDDSMSVTEHEIQNAINIVYNNTGLIIEASAAVSVAGLLNLKKTINTAVVCVITGKNIDRETFEKLTRRCAI